MLFQLRKLHHRNQRGAIIPFLAITISLAGVFAAISLDLGNTMRQRGMLHTALDSSVLRGAEERRIGRSNAEIRRAVRGITAANLTANGVSANTIANVMKRNNYKVKLPNQPSVGAESRIAHDTWFAQFLNYQSNTVDAFARSVAAYKDPATDLPNDCAEVMVIVDLSSDANSPGLGSPTVKDMMVDAARQFINSLPATFFVDVLVYSDASTAFSRTQLIAPGTGTQPTIPRSAIPLSNPQNRQSAADFISNSPTGNGRNTPWALNGAEWLLGDSKMCPGNRAAVLFTHGMPDLNSQNVGTYGPQWTDAYNCGKGSVADEIKGNAISWADRIRTNSKAPVFVVSVGDSSSTPGFDPSFMQRIAGEVDYPGLACPRPLNNTVSPKKTYFNGLDTTELRRAVLDLTDRYTETVSTDAKVIRLVY